MAKKHTDRNLSTGKYRPSGHLALLKGATDPPKNIVKSSDDNKAA